MAGLRVGGPASTRGWIAIAVFVCFSAACASAPPPAQTDAPSPLVATVAPTVAATPRPTVAPPPVQPSPAATTIAITPPPATPTAPASNDLIPGILIGVWELAGPPTGDPPVRRFLRIDPDSYALFAEDPGVSPPPYVPEDSAKGALQMEDGLLAFQASQICVGSGAVGRYNWTIFAGTELRTELVGTDSCPRSQVLAHGTFKRVGD